MKNFIEVSEHKVHELQVRFLKLTDIFNRYDTAQTELEISDQEIDHTPDRELFENQYYQVDAKFQELLHPVIESIPVSGHTSPHSSQSGRRNVTPHSRNNMQVKLPVISLPTFDGELVTGFTSEIHFKH